MTLDDLRQWHIDQAGRHNGLARYWTELSDARVKEIGVRFRDDQAHVCATVAQFHIDAAELLGQDLPRPRGEGSELP